MRHRKTGRKFGRTTAHRNMMLRNLAASIIIFERVQTTEAKAKEARRLVERVITVGKQRTLASKRTLAAILPQKTAVAKVQKELVAKYEKRNGGYTRIVHMTPRASDHARRVIIELV